MFSKLDGVLLIMLGFAGLTLSCGWEFSMMALMTMALALAEFYLVVRMTERMSEKVLCIFACTMFVGFPIGYSLITGSWVMLAPIAFTVILWLIGEVVLRLLERRFPPGS
jgi:uncharacterized membrane protein